MKPKSTLLNAGMTAILMLVMVAFTQAQTVASGVWMLGGSAGFASAKADGADDALNVLSIAPNVGYYVINNLGIGINLDFTNSSYGDFSNTSFGVGPWARYYVFQGLFPQVGVMYNSSKDKDTDAVTGTDIDLGVGYSFFLNNSVAVEPMLKYQIGGGDSKVNTFGVWIGVQAFLGRD